MGKTAAEGTSWVSDSFVVCNVAGGVEGSLLLAVTGGVLVGTETEAGSYDFSAISTALRLNMVKTGSLSMSLSGAGFGGRRWALLAFCCFFLSLRARALS